MKKYLKKTVGLFVGAAMLLTSTMPVFGSTGRINVKSYSEIVKSYESDEKISKKTDVQTVFAQNLSADLTSKDTYGAISFKVKGDVNNSNTASGIFYLDARVAASSSEKVQIQPLAIVGGKIGMNESGGAVTALNKGVEFKNDTWYNIGIVINKDCTTDYYINGEYINSSSYGKTFLEGTSVFRLLFNPKGADDDKFYVDEITWSKYSDDGFVGEIVSNTVESGGEAKIKFTELLTGFNKDDIKVYNCATGEPVSGTDASAEDNVLSVQMPNNLKPGSEYRIEFGTVKGVFGKTAVNDNVYFNCPNSVTETEDVIAYETFEGYTKSLGNSADINTNGNYYRPEGWYLKDRWANFNNVSIEPNSGSDEHGTSVKFTRTEADNNSKGGIYLPLNETIKSGKVSFSFDVNPKILSSQAKPALCFMVYPQALTAEQLPSEGKDNSKIGEDSGGRTVWAIRNLDFAHQDKANSWNSWNLNLSSSDENSKWYNVKIDFDFNNNKAVWYLDNVKQAEVDDFKSNLKLVAGNNDELSQVSAISFSIPKDFKWNFSALIDNVKVTKTISNGASDENSIFSEDFNAFENNSDKSIKVWNGNTESNTNDSYIPNGWGIRNIYADDSSLNRNASSSVYSANGKTGNAIKLEKIDGGDSTKNKEAPVIYHTLGAEYTDGILNISYDLNAEALAKDSTKSKKTFYMSLTPLALSETGKVKNIANVTTTDSASNTNWGRPIFGIQNAKFCSYITKYFDTDSDGQPVTEPYNYTIDGVVYSMGANYRKDVELNKWYNIRHTVDLTGKTVKTYIDDNLVSVTSTDALGISQVGGVSFGMDANSYESKLLIDNVSVTSQTYEMSNGGVMQVRFSDYYNNSYGAATTLTTLADTVAVAFWTNTVDTPSDTNFSLTDASGKAIVFNGRYDDDSDTYIMNLDEYLTKNTEYTLTVSGLTSNGVALPDYTQKIKSEENGELIVEPITMWKNAAGTENPVLADSGTLAQGDTVIAKTRVINTTGEEKSFAFSMAMFDDENRLMNFDCSPEIKLDGKSDKNNKEANLLCSFKMSEQDAADYARVKAFLWDGIASLKPVTPSKTFTKTAE